MELKVLPASLHGPPNISKAVRYRLGGSLGAQPTKIQKIKLFYPLTQLSTFV